MRKILYPMVLAMVTVASSSETGLKIVTVQEQPEGPPTRTTEYVGRDRWRLEFSNAFGERTSPTAPLTFKAGPQMAIVVRCDLGRQFQVNLDAREYTSGPTVNRYYLGPKAAMLRARESASPAPDRPTLSIEITTTDTGERKRVFGRTARHVITVRKETHSDPRGGEPSEMRTDGWYVDLDEAKHCDAGDAREVVAYGHLVVDGERPAPPPKVVFKEVGAPERGFPIELIYTHSAWPSASSSRKVIELSSGPLDSALFEVPRGFYHTNRWDRAAMMQARHVWRQVNVGMRQFLGLR